MKYKSIAAMAVLAMFLASSFCVLAVAEDNNGSELIVNDDVEPLKIDSTGVTHGDPKDFNAKYDKDTHTLTLNGGVDVKCNCTKDYPYMIDVVLNDFTIIVNGTTIIESDDAIPAEYGIDTGAIRLVKINSSVYDDNGILVIKGDGTLTLVPPYPSNTGTSCNCIASIYVNIIGCTLNIDGSNVPWHFRGIDALTNDYKINGSISILNATVNITGNGDKHAVGYVDVGLYSNKQ